MTPPEIVVATGMRNVAVERKRFEKGDQVSVTVVGGVARKEMHQGGYIYTDQAGHDVIVFDNAFSG